jgi:amino acid transporter
MTISTDMESSVEASGYRQELKRSLRLLDLLVYGLVFIIPIAPIPVFGIVYNASHGMVPLIYLVGLVAMVFTALTYMALSRAFPLAGSVYTYAARSIGPAAGFFSSWAVLLDLLLIPTLAYVAVAKRSPLICVKPTEGRSRSIFFRDRRL